MAHVGIWALKALKKSEDCPVRCDFITFLCLKMTGREKRGCPQRVIYLLWKQRRHGSTYMWEVREGRLWMVPRVWLCGVKSSGRWFPSLREGMKMEGLHFLSEVKVKVTS